MSDPYAPFPRQQLFEVGARVLVSGTCGGWRGDALGVVVGAPESVQTAQGADYFYWVQFDIPQHDFSNDGPYYKAQILGCCLTNAA